ncbi:hypothetical protein ACWGF3_15685 [Streptomyces xanthophaeus]|uniref:Uncharacterized protein n=1 Tax=Streptomyces xanthophaeus TaxID=67385 RepID=A0A919GRI1_9ACTN|nr:hypothetical protein [Streptomyces xanthophaeus]GHI82813.1 hypothetical protein Sxan_01770 [Streptomyces xanthophaeus]
MSGYAQQPPHRPAPDPGSSNGRKIVLGCGIPTALGLMLVCGCTALVDKATDDVSRKRDQSYDSAQFGSADTPGARDEPDITKDAKLGDCKVISKDYGVKELLASVEFTNSGDRRYTYSAEGEILVNGAKKADLYAHAEILAPGQKFTDEHAGAFGYAVAGDAKSGDTYECKLIRVTRYSS